MSKRLVVLASGNGSNLQAILNACEAERLPAQVAAVVSDRRGAFALVRARYHRVPTAYFPWKPYADAGYDRRVYDANLADLVAGYIPDYVVLAGWMRLLTSAFLDQFPMRVINLHPALPGSFPGTHAIERAYQAYQAGQIEQTGVMVHLVPDEGVDDGPVLAAAAVPIKATDSLADLEARVHKLEHRLLVETLQRVLKDGYQITS